MAISITMPEMTKSIEVEGKRKVLDFTLVGKSGVYVFRDSTGTVLYVGKSKDVSRRINEHLHTIPYSFDNRAAVVDVCLEEDPTSVDIYEAFMINELSPEYNKSGMYTAEFQRQNAEELFALETMLAEAEDEERTLAYFIRQEEENIMNGEVEDVGELVEAIRDIGYVRKRISALKRDIAVRKRRVYKEAA